MEATEIEVTDYEIVTPKKDNFTIETFHIYESKINQLT